MWVTPGLDSTRLSYPEITLSQSWEPHDGEILCFGHPSCDRRSDGEARNHYPLVHALRKWKLDGRVTAHYFRVSVKASSFYRDSAFGEVLTFVPSSDSVSPDPRRLSTLLLKRLILIYFIYYIYTYIIYVYIYVSQTLRGKHDILHLWLKCLWNWAWVPFVLSRFRRWVYFIIFRRFSSEDLWVYCVFVTEYYPSMCVFYIIYNYYL